MRGLYSALIVAGVLATFLTGWLALMRTDSLVRSSAYPWVPPRRWTRRILAAGLLLVVIGLVGRAFS